MNTYTRGEGKNELHGAIVPVCLKKHGGGVKIFGNGRRESRLTILGTFNEVDG